jgi:hypothetical protein
MIKLIVLLRMQYLYVPALNINAIADPQTCINNREFIANQTGIPQDGSIEACNAAFRVSNHAALKIQMMLCLSASHYCHSMKSSAHLPSARATGLSLCLLVYAYDIRNALAAT